MRDRAWRRYREELIVIKRIRRLNYYTWSYHRFTDANGNKINHPKTIDFISTNFNFKYKTHTTKCNDTRIKEKYSPNKSKIHWRNKGSINTREGQKIMFYKILKDNGVI